MPLQDSMAAGAVPPGVPYPSRLFASNFSQGAFAPVDPNAPAPKRPRVEESSHGPVQGSEAADGTQVVEVLSDDSEVSTGQKDTKQTDYDASTESELE